MHTKGLRRVVTAQARARRQETLSTLCFYKDFIFPCLLRVGPHDIAKQGRRGSTRIIHLVIHKAM